MSTHLEGPLYALDIWPVDQAVMDCDPDKTIFIDQFPDGDSPRWEKADELTNGCYYELSRVPRTLYKEIKSRKDLERFEADGFSGYKPAEPKPEPRNIELVIEEPIKPKQFIEGTIKQFGAMVGDCRKSTIDLGLRH